MNVTSRNSSTPSRDALLLRILMISVVVLLMLITFLIARYDGARRGRDRARQEIERSDTLRAPAALLKALGDGHAPRF